MYSYVPHIRPAPPSDDANERKIASLCTFQLRYPISVSHPVHANRSKLDTHSSLAYMNWSCVIVGATLVFPGIYWIYAARHKYLKGSNSVLEDNVVIVDGEARLAREVLKV